jgi:hypothetical protein
MPDGFELPVFDVKPVRSGLPALTSFVSIVRVSMSSRPPLSPGNDALLIDEGAATRVRVAIQHLSKAAAPCSVAGPLDLPRNAWRASTRDPSFCRLRISSFRALSTVSFVAFQPKVRARLA